jgi:hypothetical protein
MKTTKKYFILCSILVGLFASCLEPYSPPGGLSNVNHLVVDGFIDALTGSATVTLSRTVSISSADRPEPESKATLTIEDEQGTAQNLTEQESGIYGSTVLSLSFEKKYRLHIKTSGQEEYASDYVHLKRTPPIEDINYSFVDRGVQLNVNTGDPSGNTRFYYWRFTETWEYNSAYYSSFKFSPNHQVVLRPSEESLHTCWRTQHSSSILLGSTKQLAQDLVSNLPILLIPKGSIKLSIKYSMLLEQTALTEEAYNYWLNLQKNTESLGGLFDPLPSEITGNIHSLSNPEEPVIGYFSGGSVEKKRIFINANEIPSTVSYYYPPQCPMDTISIADIPKTSTSTLLITALYMGPFIIGYTSSASQCIDCRVSGGGVLQKPDFWN